MFTNEQIGEIMDIVRFQHTHFAAEAVGRGQLSFSDRQLLLRFGVNVDLLTPQLVTRIEEAFHFGRLSAALGDAQTKQLRYENFRQYLLRGAYVPLTEVEQQILDGVKSRSFRHIKRLGETAANHMSELFASEEALRRASFEDILRDEARRVLEERNSLKRMEKAIGKRTQDWERDLGRIVETEMHDAFDTGRASGIEARDGRNAKVYKDVYDGACTHCVRLYTTRGIGTEPRIFLLSKLRANGTNIGRKAADWKAVVGATHPFCRCTLREAEVDHYTWDEKTRSFSSPKPIKRKSGVALRTISVQIGDQTFIV